MKHLRPLLSLLCLLLVLSSIGCVTPTRSVTYQRTIEQTALVPAPSGPQASGPIIEAGKVAIEGGATLNLSRQGDGNRYKNNDAGNISVDTFMWGRLAGGVIEGVDVGIGFEYGNAKWGSTAYASDTHIDQLQSHHVWRVGPQLRGIFAGDRSLGIGGLVEFDLGTIPYRRTVYEKAFVTEFDGGVADKTFFLGADLDDGFDSEFYFFARAGLFGAAQIAGFHIILGGLLQNQPEFFGAKRADLVCTYYEGSAREPSCDGVEDTDDVDSYRSELLVTLYLTLAYELGPVTLILQSFGHVASGGDINRHTMAGFDMGARVSF